VPVTPAPGAEAAPLAEDETYPDGSETPLRHEDAEEPPPSTGTDAADRQGGRAE
jgi:hypothetical protein